MSVAADPAQPAAFDTTSPRARARRVLRAVRNRLSDDPRFLPIVLRATPMGTAKGIQPNTVLVIEGFPRSGNTFAYFALRSLLPEHQHIATRVHTPSQVALAVKRGLPTLYVIREPLSTITSLVVAAPHVPIAAAIHEYVHHQREVLQYRSGFVVGEFARVTSDLGGITAEVNERFGTDFPLFDATDDNVRAVFAAIDAHHLDVWGGSANVLPRPSEDRRADKDWVAAQLARPEHRSRLDEAHAVYEAFLRAP